MIRSGLGGCRIVLIEDDAMAAKAIEISLGTLGLRVTSFGSGEQALASPDIAAADFYMTDFRLPGELVGLQLLDAIQRRATRPIKAMRLTGETAPELTGSLAATRWKVLFKPVDLPRLVSAMTSLGADG
jgi:CheY-like chemotaxis protein